MRRSRGEASDLLRSVGGLLVAAGAVVLLIRKSGHHGWSDFARLLVLLVAWLVVAGKILNRPSADTYRWLLVIGAALLLLASARVARAGSIGAGEIATAGGLAAVAAGVFGVIVGSVVAALRGITTLLASSSGALSSSRGSVVGADRLGRPRPPVE